MGKAILEILSSLCPTSHDKVANTDKKTIAGLPSGKYKKLDSLI